MAPNGSVRVRLLAPLQLDRLGDLPEHDPDHGHRLAGDEVLVVERGTLTVPLRQELVLARLALRRSPTLIGGAPDRAPSGAQEHLQVRVQSATGSDLTRATGVWLASCLLRGFESRMRLLPSRRKAKSRSVERFFRSIESLVCSRTTLPGTPLGIVRGTVRIGA
jgi:hypothetical protein